MRSPRDRRLLTLLAASGLAVVALLASVLSTPLVLLQGNQAGAGGTSAGLDGKPDAVASLERWVERNVLSFRHRKSPASALSVAGSSPRPRVRSLPQQPGIWGNRAVQQLIATQAKTNARPGSQRLQWPDGESLEWPTVTADRAGAKEERKMPDKLEDDAGASLSPGVGDDEASPARAPDSMRRGPGDDPARKRWTQHVGGFEIEPERENPESFFAMRRGPPFAHSDVRYGVPARMPALETSSEDDWMRKGGMAMLGSAGAAREPFASRPQGWPVASGGGQRNQAGLKAHLRSQTLRAVTRAAGRVHRRTTALPSSFYKAAKSARSGGADDWLGLSTDMDPSDLLASPKRSSRSAAPGSPAKPFSAGFRQVVPDASPRRLDLACLRRLASPDATPSLSCSWCGQRKRGCDDRQDPATPRHQWLPRRPGTCPARDCLAPAPCRAPFARASMRRKKQSPV